MANPGLSAQGLVFLIWFYLFVARSVKVPDQLVRWSWLLRYTGTPLVLAHLVYAQSELYAPVFSHTSTRPFGTIEYTYMPFLLTALAWYHAKSNRASLPTAHAYAFMTIILNLDLILVDRILFQYSTELGPLLGPRLGNSLVLWPAFYLAIYATARDASNLHRDDRHTDFKYGEALRKSSVYGPIVQIALYTALAYSQLWRSFYNMLSLRAANEAISLSRVLRLNAIKAGMLDSSYLAILLYSSSSGMMSCHSKEQGSRWRYIFPSLMLSNFVMYRFIAPETSPHFYRGVIDAYSQQLPVQYKILDRVKSVTGLVSVAELQIEDRWIRYLRVDHSLLGGLWLDGPGTDIASAESIYTTFHLQEAVRLVEGRPSNNRTALILGLGIGSVVNGLEKHGVQTAVVEIDPMVYSFAKDYFGLTQPSGGAYLMDAIEYLDVTHQTYDYVIHDVFTGGTMPADLLTKKIWAAIKTKLKPEGIIAINFAGKPDSKNGKIILNTILHSFNVCHAFNDKINENTAHLNMVIFCSESDFSFRKAIPADYLGSYQREKALRDFGERRFNLSSYKTDAGPLTARNATKLNSQAERIEHWHIMRKVLPAYVWQMY